MVRKKKEQYLIDIAHRCISGFYGKGRVMKKRVNDLGYGDIYTKVQNYVNLILAGKVKWLALSGLYPNTLTPINIC